jgi:mRNA interferase YafQ
MVKFRQTTNSFDRDVKRARKRGKDISKLKAVMSKLTHEETLEARHRDHKLRGSNKAIRECHIDPDWLLMYHYEGAFIIFERTGTHSDLFD